MKKCFIFILSVLLFCFSSCNICENEIIREDELSDNRQIVLFSRDAGATTKESFQISILGKKEKLGNKKGNICVTDGTFLDYKITETTIYITYNGNLYLNKEQYENFQIYYSKK